MRRQYCGVRQLPRPSAACGLIYDPAGIETFQHTVVQPLQQAISQCSPPALYLQLVRKNNAGQLPVI